MQLPMPSQRRRPSPPRGATRDDREDEPEHGGRVLAEDDDEIGVRRVPQVLMNGLLAAARFSSLMFESVARALERQRDREDLPVHGVATGAFNWSTFAEVAFEFRLTWPLLFSGVVFGLAMGVLGGRRLDGRPQACFGILARRLRGMFPLQILHRLVVGFFSRLATYSTERPGRVIGVAIAITLAAAPGAARATRRTDGHALVSEDAPEVRFDKTVREQFGIEIPIVILVQPRHLDGIYNPATLQLVRGAHGEIQANRGDSFKPGSKPRHRDGFCTRPGAIQFRNLARNPRVTKQELEQLREDLRRIGLYTDYGGL